MGLPKQTIEFSFAKGVDTKTDPNQVQIGKFLTLVNMVFTKTGLLTKRNGFGNLTALNATDLSNLTTYSSSLVALGNELNVFSEEQGIWLDKGHVNQISLNTLALVRSSTSQFSVDASLAFNGLSCEAWEDSDGTSKYQVNDSSNGQVLLNAVNLPSGATLPRVFALNRYFVVTFLIEISSTFHLQYIAIPFTNLNSPSTVTNISSQVKSITTGYDGIVNDSILYIAWNGSDIGGAIRQCSINQNLIQSSTHTIGTHTADLISVQVNTTNNNVWITYWNSSNNNAYLSILDSNGGSVLTPTLVISNIVITEITGVIQNNVLNLFYEVSNTYSSGVRSDYIQTETVTQSGTVGTPKTVLRSVGLASKAFINNGIVYILCTYGGSFQPTYFLSDINGNIQAKLAYSNGEGYKPTQVLPNVSINPNGDIYIPYLFKDLLLSVSKLNTIDTAQAGTQTVNNNIYTQTGINGVTFNFNTGALTAEIGANLNLTGGFLSAYDGVLPVEQNFHVWPEDISFTISGTGGGLKPLQYWYQWTYEWTDGQGNLFRSAPSVPLKVDSTNTSVTPVTFTSTFSSGVSSITASSVTGLFPGQYITDSTTSANIQANTYITSIVGTTLFLSLPTSGASGSPDTLSTNNVVANTIVIPTLRLTEKVGTSLVRIVGYRWSTDNQSYYQTTSITSPLLNDPTIDTVTFVDRNNDNEIVGNPLIYTTGGVVENISPPSTQLMTLWQDRLFIVDAEDPNTICFSKQVIKATPVEMSDLLTIYVAPTLGADGSTGPITAIGAMDGNLIIFKQNLPYYITGTGPDNTGSNNLFSDPTAIASSVGCSNQSSIVLIPQGLMFQSQNGIWILNRNLTVSYIGDAVEQFNSSKVLSAGSIPETNQVRFRLDNGIVLVYDFYVNQWSWNVGIPGISSCIYNGMDTYLDQFGNIYSETSGVYLDGSNPVLMSFTTAWIKTVTLQGWQRAYWCELLGTYFSPHTLTVGVAYDFDPAILQQAPIVPDNYSPPWGGDTVWGGPPDKVWGGNSKSEQWQINFKKQSCQSFQLTLNEQYDPSIGPPAGAGLTISGLNLVVGLKKSYPRNISTKHRTG